MANFEPIKDQTIPEFEEDEVYECVQKNKLLPCPFCGGCPEIYYIGNSHTKKRSTVIECDDCNIKKVVSAKIYTLEFTERECIEQWNTRHG